METSFRHAIPLIATVLLAALFLVRGSFHPLWNYDVIPYTALAKEMRGAGGKAEAYQEFARKVGTDGFQLYVSGPYRERMYRDDEFFRANQQLYTIRPFYIFVSSLVGTLIRDDVAATHVVSAVAAALAVLLSFALAGTAGLTGNWRLAVPLTWIAIGGMTLAELSTPDALETLLGLLFVFISMRGPWTRRRAAGLFCVAILMVATRTDALLFVTCLLLMEGLLEPRHRPISVLVFLGALATYLVIQKLSGNHGYVALLNFSLLEDRSHAVVPNLVPNFGGYVVVLVHQLLQILGENVESALWFVAVSLLAFAFQHERRLRATGATDRLGQRALILTAALLLFLVARFVLFPLPIPRYVMSAYVLTGILFVRAIQPPAVAAATPGSSR